MMPSGGIGPSSAISAGPLGASRRICAGQRCRGAGRALGNAILTPPPCPRSVLFVPGAKLFPICCGGLAVPLQSRFSPPSVPCGQRSCCRAWSPSSALLPPSAARVWSSSPYETRIVPAVVTMGGTHHLFESVGSLLKPEAWRGSGTMSCFWNQWYNPPPPQGLALIFIPTGGGPLPPGPPPPLPWTPSPPPPPAQASPCPPPPLIPMVRVRGADGHHGLRRERPREGKGK